MNKEEKTLKKSESKIHVDSEEKQEFNLAFRICVCFSMHFPLIIYILMLYI